MDAARASSGWQHRNSVDEVVRLCETAFYAHDLDLLSPAEPFGVRYRIDRVGPLTLGDITYTTDVRLDFGELATGST
jgi:hypothetical protein